MYFASALILLAVPVAYATPANMSETINLDNGSSIISTTIQRDLVGLLGARDSGPSCKGSSRCSNSQDMKNACSGAELRIQATIYSNGGAKSGVCDSHCGLFVQGSKAANGKTCTATGTDLSNAYNAIQSAGCQTCGSVAAPAGGDCRIKVDYVSSC